MLACHRIELFLFDWNGAAHSCPIGRGSLCESLEAGISPASNRPQPPPTVPDRPQPPPRPPGAGALAVAPQQQVLHLLRLARPRGVVERRHGTGGRRPPRPCTADPADRGGSRGAGGGKRGARHRPRGCGDGRGARRRRQGGPAGNPGRSIR